MLMSIQTHTTFVHLQHTNEDTTIKNDYVVRTFLDELTLRGYFK